MQEGSLRCDANISVRPAGSETLGTKIEIKNLNSFRAVERAVEFEIARQGEALNDGGTLVQETRLWDEHREETRSMRSKESAHDYRYFPDPDLLPLVIPESWIDEIRAALPELPAARKQRFLVQTWHTALRCRAPHQPQRCRRLFRERCKSSQQSQSAGQLDRRRSFSRTQGAQTRRATLYRELADSVGPLS